MPSDLPLQRSLRRELTGVLIFKLALIVLAGFTIFGAHSRLHIDVQEMRGHILKPSVENQK